MWRAKLNCEKSDWTRFRFSAVAAMMLTACFAGVSTAHGQGPKTFSSIFSGGTERKSSHREMRPRTLMSAPTSCGAIRRCTVW
jgi:hypothetical protein